MRPHDARRGACWSSFPTYNERDNIEPIVAPAARRPTRGARAGGRRRQPRRHRRDRRPARGRRTTASTCCTGRPRPASARPTSPGSGWALERGYDVVVEMDADGSHAPEQLPRLLDRAAPTPTSCSARAGCPAEASSTGRCRGAALPRRQRLHPAGARACRSVTPPAASAPTARRSCEGSTSTPSPRRATASRSTWPGARCATGFRVVEVPITFVERERGDSKMSNGIVREAFWRVTVWGVRHRVRQLRGLVAGQSRAEPRTRGRVRRTWCRAGPAGPPGARPGPLRGRRWCAAR